MNQLSFLFGGVRDERARDVAAFVGDLPQLSRGLLAECDLGVGSSGDRLACVARFRVDPPEAVRTRLAFWAWRFGGSIPAEPEARPAGSRHALAPELRGCDRLFQGVAPGLLRCALASLLGRITGLEAALGRTRLALRLALGSPEAAGVSYDRRRAALFVPSPHPLPPGDAFSLELRLPDGEVMEADAVVAALRAAGEVGPGSPAGLVAGLASASGRLVDALETHAGPLALNRRRAPRYPVRARANLGPRPGAGDQGAPPAAARSGRTPGPAEGLVENLSQSGAFVRTAERLPPGARVALDLQLPGGAAVAAPAVVVYGNDRGLGLRFEVDAAGEAAVADALAAVTARRRRALVVDDDLLARRMLGDALAERGFEVFASADGADGLRVLTEQLLGLDLLVTDIRMPGLDGEHLVRLVRGAGGEQDLAIVVVGGDVDSQVERRLLASGADAVLAKGRGAGAIGEAAEQAVLSRHRSGRMPAQVLARSA
jgi:CheY-like chemotaxis protein